MELQPLRCFVAVAEHGSFTAAAAALHVTQPSVSHAVARLESQLRLRLFHRAPRGISLTADGEALLIRARGVLRAADDVTATAAAIRGVTAGTLHLVAFRTFTTRAAAAVGRFCRRFPAVTVRLLAPDTNRGVVDLVTSHTCDVAFARLLDIPPQLAVREVTSEQTGLVLPPDRERSVPEGEVPLAEAARWPLVVPPAGTDIRVQLEHLVHRSGVAVTVAAECDHYESTIEMVRAGVGAAIGLRESLPRSMRHCFRPFADSPPIPVGLVYRPDRLSPAAAAFVSFADHLFPPADDTHANG